MKTYILTLKGTKKAKTQDMKVSVFGDNKQQAFNWAYKFFQLGEFVEPYFAKGLNKMSGGTAEFIPESINLMGVKGKYKVNHSNLKFK